MSKEELKQKIRENHFNTLVERGLNKVEAETFINLIDKLAPTNSDIEGFHRELESSIPFEGGMGFTEALTGLKSSC